MDEMNTINSDGKAFNGNRIPLYLSIGFGVLVAFILLEQTVRYFW